jgi:hypothetical protein
MGMDSGAAAVGDGAGEGGVGVGIRKYDHPTTMRVSTTIPIS